MQATKTPMHSPVSSPREHLVFFETKIANEESRSPVSFDFSRVDCKNPALLRLRETYDKKYESAMDTVDFLCEKDSKK